MRTFGTAWEAVYIIGISVAFMVHVSKSTSAFPKPFFIKSFLLLIFIYVTLLQSDFQRHHSGFPTGGITPAVQQPANFIRIGIMYLRIHKKIVPVKRKGDVSLKTYMIPRTIPAVYNSNNDTSIESDALEITVRIYNRLLLNIL